MKEIHGNSLEGYIFADLHMHTTGSLDVVRKANGLAPHEAVLSAELAGLSALAITDHDNLDSAYQGYEFAMKEGLEVMLIPGMEITTRDGHLVGLYLTSPVEKGLPMTVSIRRIHEQKGIAIAPHPFFRILNSPKRRAISDVIRSNDPDVYFDGFETHNTGVEDVAGRRKITTNSNPFAQRFYNNHPKDLGAPIGSSDGHRMTVGRGVTAFKGDVKDAIKNSRTMAVAMEFEDNRQLVLNAIELFGEKRVLGELTVTQFEERYKKPDKPPLYLLQGRPLKLL